jgi:hypothetical protein
LLANSGKEISAKIDNENVSFAWTRRIQYARYEYSH